MDLLAMVKEKLDDNGYTISNIDTIIVAEKPKLKEFIPEMILNISSALDIDKDQVAIKATTKEKMDATGKGKSMEAYAICLITG